MRGTVPVAASADLAALIEAVFEEQLKLRKDSNGDALGLGYYKLVFDTECGVMVQALHRLMEEADPGQHQLITLSGTPLSRLDPPALEMLLTGLSSLGFKATRLDLKLDDFTKTVTPELAFQAAEMGNTKGFRRYRRTQSDDGGYTFYGGSRGSDRGGKYLRIYIKSVESGGEIDATRIDGELSSDKAHEAFDRLTMAPLKMWPRFVVSVIAGCYNFLDRSVSPRADRCPQLSWWAAVITNPKG